MDFYEFCEQILGVKFSDIPKLILGENEERIAIISPRKHGKYYAPMDKKLFRKMLKELDQKYDDFYPRIPDDYQIKKNKDLIKKIIEDYES